MLSHTRRKNTLNSQSAFWTLSAVYILYPICTLHSAFCTNRYPWHQYSLFLVTVIRTTHSIYHKIPVYELITSTFYFFSELILFPFVKMWTSLTMFQLLHSPKKKKKTLASKACLCFGLWYSSKLVTLRGYNWAMACYAHFFRCLFIFIYKAFPNLASPIS